ncbi:MAG: cyclic-di-AMP receptor [Anaerolineales bacterium]|nr:cyclic-di-AMP receptor [Anaerolineales bacterium]
MDIDTLVLAIIQREDADAAIGTLNHAGFAVTLISTIGGFLRTGNVTLLIGLRSNDVEQAIGLLKTQCHKRIVHSSLIASAETDIGGATIFVFPVARYIHLGTTYTIADFQREPSPLGTLQMILAIVSDEQAGKLLETLTDWSYRATLISTTGGFLHRGNATLLIGVRSERVDSIVEQIRQVCQTNSTNEPSATIFVLDVARLERV